MEYHTSQMKRERSVVMKILANMNIKLHSMRIRRWCQQFNFLAREKDLISNVVNVDRTSFCMQLTLLGRVRC